MLFRSGSYNRAGAHIDGRLRHTVDIEAVRQVRKFHRLDRFGFDPRAFDRHFVSKHHGLRAPGSGWGDKNLQVHGPV